MTRGYVVILIIALLHFLPIAGAIVDFNNLKDSVDRYNNNIEKAPPVLKALMGNERINMTIITHDGKVLVWGIETKNARIVKYALGGLDNPTIDEYASEDAINEVLNSSDAAEAFHRASDAGRIRIEGRTEAAKLKVAAMLCSGEAIRYYFGMFN